MKINIEDNNLSPYNDLMVAGTGSTTEWVSNDYLGAYSYRELNLDPWGNTVYTNVKCGTDATSRHSTYNNYTIPLDNTKSYQVSGWMRLKDVGSTPGRFYWFLNHVENNATRVIDGLDVTSSAYFAYNANVSNILGEDWRLFVAYLRPIGWSGTTNEGGCFDVSGNTVGNTIIYDWIPNSAVTIIRWRLMSPYNGDSKIEMLYPRIDVVDGTEPSIATLLSNEGSWRNVNSGGTYINIEDNNLSPYTDLMVAGTGSTTEWVSNDLGAYSYRELNLDPWGNTVYTNVKAGIDATSRHSTYNYYQDIDNTKSYQVSGWFRLKDSGTTTARFYWYLDGSHIGATRVIDGEYTGSSGFFAYNINCKDVIGEDWRLLVAYLRPIGWSGTTNEGGCFDVSGNTVGNTIIYDWIPNSAVTRHRWRLMSPYNGDEKIEMLYPRIDVVDGTEPSITTLLSNEGSWRKI